MITLTVIIGLWGIVSLIIVLRKFFKNPDRDFVEAMSDVKLGFGIGAYFGIIYIPIIIIFLIFTYLS